MFKKYKCGIIQFVFIHKFLFQTQKCVWKSENDIVPCNAKANANFLHPGAQINFIFRIPTNRMSKKFSTHETIFESLAFQRMRHSLKKPFRVGCMKANAETRKKGKRAKRQRQTRKKRQTRKRGNEKPKKP